MPRSMCPRLKSDRDKRLHRESESLDSVSQSRVSLLPTLLFPLDPWTRVLR